MRMRYSFVILACTALSFIFTGYQSLVADHYIYFPPIFHSLAGISVSSGDMLTTFNQLQYTLFGDLFVGLVKFSGLNVFVAMFLLTAASRALVFWGVMRLARFFSGSDVYAMLAPLLFVAGSPVFGTGKDTLDAYLHPYMLALALGLLSLTFLLEKRTVVASALSGASFLIHPLGTLPFFLLSMFTLLGAGNARSMLRAGLQFAAFPVLCAVWLFAAGGAGSGGGFFRTIDPAWLAAIMAHEPYVFITRWGSIPWAYLLPAFVSGAVAFFTLKNSDRSRRLVLWGTILLPFAGIASALLLVDALHLAFFTAVQMARLLVLSKYVLLIVLGYHVFEHARSHPRDLLYLFFGLGVVCSLGLREVGVWPFLLPFVFLWCLRYTSARQWLTPRYDGFFALCLYVFFWCALGLVPVFFHTASAVALVRNIAFMNVLVVLFFGLFLAWRAYGGRLARISAALCIAIGLVASAVLLQRPFSFSSAIDPALTALCTWIQGNTPDNALFLADPNALDGHYVRSLCNRGVYVMENDGAQAVFNRAYALEWTRRMQFTTLFAATSSISAAQWAHEGVTHVLLRHSVVGLGAPVYDQNGYSIYAVSK